MPAKEDDIDFIVESFLTCTLVTRQGTYFIYKSGYISSFFHSKNCGFKQVKQLCTTLMIITKYKVVKFVCFALCMFLLMSHDLLVMSFHITKQ